ncbi:alpha/beta hydrolase, partial [bacterium]|nr:alpha/beta hydrolase [bacterium]
LAKILNELDITPKRVSVDGKEIVIYKSDIQGLIAMSIISIRGGADQVPLWVASMKDGDFSEVAKNLYEYQSSDGPQSMMSLAMDSMSGASQTRQTRIENESETCLLGGSMNANLPEIAQALGVTPLSDEFRSTLNTSVPIMFVVGSLDYRTPVTNARELADHMPNSHLVIIENCGHSDLPLGMPEVRDLWGKFLASGAGRSETFSGPEIHLAYHDENSAELPANAIELSLDQLEEFTGEYRFEQGDIVSVRAVEGHLILTFPDRREFSLWPQSESEFFADVKQIPTLTFSRDEAGNVSSFGGGGMTAKKMEDQNTKAIDLTAERLDEFVGFYDYGEWGQLKITRDGKELYAQLPGQQSMAISPTSSTELQWKRIPARLSLVRNEQGKIVSGTHHQNDNMLEVIKVNQ